MPSGETVTEAATPSALPVVQPAVGALVMQPSGSAFWVSLPVVVLRLKTATALLLWEAA